MKDGRADAVWASISFGVLLGWCSPCKKNTIALILRARTIKDAHLPLIA